MTTAVLGIIGGSGIYDLPGLENVRDEAIASPWGEPSAPLRHGTIAGLPIVFLPRHDKGHRLSPSDINYRANIDVLKRAGVTDLISLSACGSFKEELPPGTFVLVDQFVDRTYRRESSFFGKGCVAHVSMAHPASPRLRIHLAAAAEAEGIAVARGGTYVCMEGPQFSSYAESMTYKDLGYSVIGMTNMPEAKLAREAEICYASAAMVTDFDCWHPDHDAVTVQDIIRVLNSNAEKAKGLVPRLARDFPREHEPCPIGSDRALDTALITAPEARDPELLKKLDAVAGRVLRLHEGRRPTFPQHLARAGRLVGRRGRPDGGCRMISSLPGSTSCDARGRRDPLDAGARRALDRRHRRLWDGAGDAGRRLRCGARSRLRDADRDAADRDQPEMGARRNAGGAAAAAALGARAAAYARAGEIADEDIAHQPEHRPAWPCLDRGDQARKKSRASGSTC